MGEVVELPAPMPKLTYIEMRFDNGDIHILRDAEAARWQEQLTKIVARSLDVIEPFAGFEFEKSRLEWGRREPMTGKPIDE